jgi:ATP-binding cassette subfamily B protein
MRTSQGHFEEATLGKTYDRKLLRRLYPYLRPYRYLVLASVVIVMMITLLELSLPYVIKIAIDRYIVPVHQPVAAGPAIPTDDPNPSGTAENRLHPPPAENGGTIEKPALSDQERAANITGLNRICALFVLLVLLNFGLNFVQRMVMEYAGHMIMHTLRLDIFRHMERLSMPFFTRNPVGRLVTRATNDVQNMHELFTSVISMVFKDIFLLVGITIAMLSLSPSLALASFTVLPLVVLAVITFAGKARDIFRSLRVKVAEINTRFAETIGGIKVIQSFRKEEINYDRFRELNHENYLIGMRQIHVLAVFMPLMEVLGMIALAIVIYYGGRGVLSEQITLGVLAAFLSYLKMFFRPIRDLSEKFNILQNAMASAERIFLVLDNHEVEDPNARPVLEQAAGREAVPDDVALPPLAHIRFENVSFGYNADEKVLHRISFTINAGESVAVVGPTGAGKTSLINLISRFYQPTEGRVLYNGTDIQRYRTDQIRSKMALVTQDPFLFSGTIISNIFRDNDGTGPDQIERILDLANCTALVNRLPQGIHTPLTEGGATLSSGERQLISIARAFAHNPELIIMDEATSYIDSQTEVLIHGALDKLLTARTSLIIAHRLSTVRNADRILVLNRGRIVETGNHRELIDRQGLYFQLHQHQQHAVI